MLVSRSLGVIQVAQYTCHGGDKESRTFTPRDKMADIHVAALMQSSVKGLTASSFSSNRSFSRHSHEEYGVGVIVEGAQRS